MKRQYMTLLNVKNREQQQQHIGNCREKQKTVPFFFEEAKAHSRVRRSKRVRKNKTNRMNCIK